MTREEMLARTRENWRKLPDVEIKYWLEKGHNQEIRSRKAHSKEFSEVRLVFCFLNQLGCTRVSSQNSATKNAGATHNPKLSKEAEILCAVIPY